MQPVHTIEKTINDLFEPIIGKVRIKTYFSYYGLFKDNLMFALFKNEQLYLRKTSNLSDTIEKADGVTLLNDKNVGISANSFYFLPNNIVKEHPSFPHWIKLTIEQLKAAKSQQEDKYKNQIRSMRNMNVKFERILKKIEINSIAEFKEYGYLNTFVRLIQAGSDGSDLLLYKLHGAICGRSIYSLTDEEKYNLKIEANNALREAGLRQRFRITSEA